MSWDNLLSGLFGALGAVLLGHLYTHILEKFKIREIRTAILTYHIHTVIPKTKTYIENAKNALDEVKHVGQFVVRNRIYDDMPMLTIDFYKAYSSHEIFKAVGGGKNFIDIIDIYHTIDFLKFNMPLKIVNEFTHKIDNHMQLESISYIPDHISKCDYCKDQIIRYTENLNLKIKAASELLGEIDKLNKILKS